MDRSCHLDDAELASIVILLYFQKVRFKCVELALSMWRRKDVVYHNYNAVFYFIWLVPLFISIVPQFYR